MAWCEPFFLVYSRKWAPFTSSRRCPNTAVPDGIGEPLLGPRASRPHGLHRHPLCCIASFFARNEPCLERIGLDVVDDRTQVGIVTNMAIVVVRVPDRTFSLKVSVDGFGGERFPTVYDVPQGELVERFDEHMDMVGHYR
ncbi:MAG: hypothetical protein BWY17_03092 [Deltaproteobacteria bacterium ADurb.Bin207]|nr:MAG: hypothetical protein BWY17_03092 [Deltaproteobacteria bacterium ADurb.Bin207]